MTRIDADVKSQYTRDAAFRILTFTTLYPNAAQPLNGVFVENRLRQLVASGKVISRVVAPIPWFPSRNPVFGRYADLARAPIEEERFGIPVLHPRYPVIPKIGMSLTPFGLYAAARPVVHRMLEAGDEFDLIDAHYFYPDGVAAAMLAQHFGKPLTITARGTDINLIPRYRLPRRMIQWAANSAAGLITVSQALKDRLADLGIDPGSIQVLRNGVDLKVFRRGDRKAIRDRLGVGGTVLATVGNLVPLKGHELVIRALPQIPDATLLVVGQGQDEPALKRLTASLSLERRVRFLGAVPHESMRDIYNAADVLVLASSREGWPNVVLEAMACGTPVVATDVGGIREVVAAPEAGTILDTRSPEAIAAAVRGLLADPPDREKTRRYAEGFGWQQTTDGQLALFERILMRGTAASGQPCERRRANTPTTHRADGPDFVPRV